MQYLSSDFLEINLEKRRDTWSIFGTVTDVYEVAERLSVLGGVPIVPGETLLFLDEIQCSPDAIRMLRCFKEDFPELHVIAAGSLLEFALDDLYSVGVGRVTSLFMYPLSFKEYLSAQNKWQWIEAIEKAGVDTPFSRHCTTNFSFGRYDPFFW